MEKIKFSLEELSNFCLEVSSLLHAGVPEAEALALLAEGEEDACAKQMLSAAAVRMDDGAALSVALREACGLPAYLCGLLEVGEHSGRTEEALAALSEYYEQRHTMERQMHQALLYPMVMLVLMLLVIGVLLVKVMPLFDAVYATLGTRLTGMASGLLLLGQGLSHILPFLGVLLAGIVLFCVAFFCKESFRKRVLAALQRKCGDKGLLCRRNNAKIVQAMAMAMRSGLTAEEALGLASGLVADIPAAKERCTMCRRLVEDGMPIAEALQESRILRMAQCRLFRFSERSGTGDMAMERIAHMMAEETQAELEDTIGKIEPALVMLCSALVGIILLSVMLPLMHIMTAIG